MNTALTPSPNDSYFLCWVTATGLDFVVYCEHQRWLMPPWVSPLHLGVLLLKPDGSKRRVWADA